MNRHSKWSVLYLRHCRRVCSCSEIKIASRRLCPGAAVEVEGRELGIDGGGGGA